MKNKGFTLVELLAVIAIIGILAIITVPNVLKTVNKAKDGTKSIEENQVLDVAKLYVQDYCEHPISGNTCVSTYNKSTSSGYVCLKELQNLGLIDEVYFGDTKCYGMVKFNSNTKNPDKAYFKCGTFYETNSSVNVEACK